MRYKVEVYSLVSMYYDSLNLAYNKTKLYKIWNYWSRDILTFGF